MRADIIPGGTFPDYELTDHTRTWMTVETTPLSRHPNDPAMIIP
jgi:muconolactone delta-isomerase